MPDRADMFLDDSGEISVKLSKLWPKALRESWKQTPTFLIDLYGLEKSHIKHGDLYTLVSAQKQAQ